MNRMMVELHGGPADGSSFGCAPHWTTCRMVIYRIDGPGFEKGRPTVTHLHNPAVYQRDDSIGGTVPHVGMDGVTRMFERVGYRFICRVSQADASMIEGERAKEADCNAGESA